MDSARWTEIRSIFDELVDLSEDERRLRLAGFAATDPELGRWLEALLEADAQPEQLLDEPERPWPEAARLLDP